MRTEQQQKIEKLLLSLVNNFRHDLNIVFVSNENAESERERPVSRATIQHGKVVLYLVEKLVSTCLDDWADAIVKAEVLLGEIQKERIHEFQNPNFFKSISSQVYHETKRKQW